MSLSSGKASGKTITLSAYLDWFEDATGINDSDPKEWHELRERIAELEAELAMEKEEHSECDASVQGVVTRAEKAEAEVERLTADLETALKIIKDGGRESGESGLAPGVEVANHGNAAANPAARKERDEG